MAFNKMFVMLPVMLAARKLDGEDQNIIFLLRCLYGAVQTIALLVVLFVYHQARTAASDKSNDVVIYVPPPLQPFQDPNAKITYQERSLSSQILTSARGLLGSTFFGICMTVGLHIWKGMVVGLAIQSVMAPFNLYENPLVKVAIGGGFTDLENRKIFGEKRREEMNDDDHVTDSEGKAIILKGTAISNREKKENEWSLEDVILDTWDLGEDANIATFLSAMTEGNINNVTKENAWAPIMVVSGLGAKGVGDALKKMKILGAHPEIVDKEGWNALHWVRMCFSFSMQLFLLLNPLNILMIPHTIILQQYFRQLFTAVLKQHAFF